MNAYLEIERDGGIRVSLRPVSFVEAARIYILPQEILLFDRIHSYKTSLSYGYLSDIIGFNITYTDVQDLLLGEFHSTPSRTVSALNADEADIHTGGGHSIAADGGIKVIPAPGSELFYRVGRTTGILNVAFYGTDPAVQLAIRYDRSAADRIPRLVEGSFAQSGKGTHRGSLRIRSAEPLFSAPGVHTLPSGRFDFVSPEELFNAFK